MTNITLSIENSTYKRMKGHSEVKWSEFVRKMINKRLDELEMIENTELHESLISMLASEEVLEKEWDNDLDKRWDNV